MVKRRYGVGDRVTLANLHPTLGRWGIEEADYDKPYLIVSIDLYSREFRYRIHSPEMTGTGHARGYWVAYDCMLEPEAGPW